MRAWGSGQGLDEFATSLGRGCDGRAQGGEVAGGRFPDALGLAVPRSVYERKARSVVLSEVLPGRISWASGKPTGVATSAMTTCTQSERCDYSPWRRLSLWSLSRALGLH